MYSVGCCLCGGGGRASSKLYSHIYRRPGGNVYFPGLTVATHSYSNTPAHSASLISYFVWSQSGVLAYDIGYICLYCTNILLAHQYCFGVISNLWPRELITNQVWFPRQQIVNPKWLPRQLITNPKSWPRQQISNIDALWGDCAGNIKLTFLNLDIVTHSYFHIFFYTKTKDKV